MPVRYYDWIAHFGRRTPDKIAAIDLASERRLSYAQFDARVSRLATHLRDELGVKLNTSPTDYRPIRDGYMVEFRDNQLNVISEMLRGS